MQTRLLIAGALALAATLLFAAQTTARVEQFPVSHFACYPAQFTGGKHPLVKLKNQFGNATAYVGTPQRLCAPARKNTSGIVNPKAHLACYSLTHYTTTAKNHVVSSKNQFGTQQMTVVVNPPQYLCAPSSKAPVGAVPGAVPTVLDHYLCYAVDPGTFKQINVKVGDQFNTSTDTVVGARTLCVPTSKNGSHLVEPKVHLLCYLVKSASHAHAVVIRNQFGIQNGSAGQRDRLCVPSTKKIVS